MTPSQWVSWDQRLHCGKASGLCVCVCVPARVRARANRVENQKARLIVKGSVELPHLKAQFVPELRILHVFVPLSVNNFRLSQFWTHKTTFHRCSRVCGRRSSLNADCQSLDPTSNELGTSLKKIKNQKKIAEKTDGSHAFYTQQHQRWIIKHNDLIAVFYCCIFRRTPPLFSTDFLAPVHLLQQQFQHSYNALWALMIYHILQVSSKTQYLTQRKNNFTHHLKIYQSVRCHFWHGAKTVTIKKDLLLFMRSCIHFQAFSF